MLRALILGCVLLYAMPNALGREVTAADYLERASARLAVLDKITARVKTLTVTVGEVGHSGRLRLGLVRCAETPPELTPEAVAYVTLAEVLGDEVESDGSGATPLFAGWIFASSPGLSAVEHPVYDVWLIDCLDDGVVGTE
ncbi:MAG: DUF2155 domain-containing protein [Alphaproteobacteria bacterium]|nr:DUF2155 domain-containing protein [Alphaproteobacteria bacterium]